MVEARNLSAEESRKNILNRDPFHYRRFWSCEAVRMQSMSMKEQTHDL